jgi:hypothetical protein
MTTQTEVCATRDFTEVSPWDAAHKHKRNE